MALPLLVGSAVVFIVFTVAYLRKVVEPHVLRLDALVAARAAASFGEQASRASR